MNGDVIPAQASGEFLLFQAQDGQTRLEVRVQDGTVWLTQKQMAELFQTTVANINTHLRNIFREGELDAGAVIKESLITASDGKHYKTKFYRLEAILAVGYRVRSHRGTQFRQWATERLREYVVKGFALDDERLKKAGGDDYFDELLARIRDIRSTERLFWRKVLDIYATSIDYDPSLEASKRFFATVQNKMHWAAHGHTAAELIHKRADANSPNMGLNNFAGLSPRQQDVEIAKNYLGADELDALNRIVTLYLDFAELQALNRTPMTMQDWLTKLDQFLRLSGREVLDHAGKVSHQQALAKARQEYARFKAAQAEALHPVDRDFETATKALASMAKAKPRQSKRKGDD